MDKKIGTQHKLDDTMPLNCTIENAQNTQGHIDYVLRVERSTVTSWQVIRRYNDFVTLHTSLQMSHIDLPLPPKKIFGNMDREFVAERQLGLQNYLNIILANPMLGNSLPVKKFLDPTNYSINFQEMALQYVSMLIRSEPEWEIIQPIQNIGWRIRKEFFLVQNSQNPKEKFFLSWNDTGPDRSMDDKDTNSTLKALTNLKHPYIQPITFASSSDSGGFIVHPLASDGSLRDRICKANLRHHFLAKYANPKDATPLPLGQIRSYGRQILEALKFLYDKGFFYGHLNSGNILLQDSTCRLSDIHNSVLGLRCQNRQFIVQLRKISTLESIDVYNFGHVLYEMAMGKPLFEPTCDTFPSTSPTVASILESILSTDACKRGLPTLTDLLSNSFFQDAPTAENSMKPTFKLTAQLKEALKQATTKIENGLKEQQKAFRQLKRVIKANAILTLDNGRKKTKQPTKKNNEREESTPPPSPAPTCSSVAAPPPPPPSMISNCLPSPPPPPPPTPSTEAPPSSGRKALLGSIEGFNKTGLRKIQTNDRSKPLV